MVKQLSTGLSVEARSTKGTVPSPQATISIDLAALPDGPAIRPLNYSDLGTANGVHGELERTVQDLGAWLAHIDGSLKGLLDTL